MLKIQNKILYSILNKTNLLKFSINVIILFFMGTFTKGKCRHISCFLPFLYKNKGIFYHETASCYGKRPLFSECKQIL